MIKTWQRMPDNIIKIFKISSKIEIELVNLFLEKRINTNKTPASSISMMKNVNPARKNISEKNFFSHFTILVPFLL